MLVACCSSTYIFTLPYLLSLSSFDRVGVRLLSPCGSQITITPDAGPDDSAPADAYELKWESTKTLNDTMFPFLMISSGAQLGVIGTVSHVGLFFHFGAVAPP